jgi:DNA-cytosine methyltransferase
MIHLDLFSGIGGFSYAVDQVWPDVEHIFVEIDPFCKKILAKHWPSGRIYNDIKEVTGAKIIADAESGEVIGREEWTQRPPIRDRKVDLLTGGFPCQGFSHAGKRKGRKDERYLWPEMFRVIREVKPTWVIAENVRGLLTIESGLVFEQVCSDLEGEGYGVQAFVIPACAVNAPHRRDRLWFVAHANDGGESREIRKEISRWEGPSVTSPESCGGSSRGDSIYRQSKGKEQEKGTDTTGITIREMPRQRSFAFAVKTKVSANSKHDGFTGTEASRKNRETQSKEPSGAKLSQYESTGNDSIRGTELRRNSENDTYTESIGLEKYVLCQGSTVRQDDSDVADPNARRLRRCEREGIEERSASCGSTVDVANSGSTRRAYRVSKSGEQIGAGECRDSGQEYTWETPWIEVATEFCRVDDGVPVEMDGLKLTKSKHRVERLKALGNSIVPTVVVEIMKAIKYSNEN